jgi:chloride channel protein, CIC family
MMGLQNGFSWLPQIVRLTELRIRRQGRLLGLAIVIGIVAGIGAIVFYVATRVVEHFCMAGIVGYHPAVRPAGEVDLSWLPAMITPFHPWLLLIVPTVGGLISGWIVFTFAPEAEGHGTDNVIDAYHRKQGQIRPRVPLIKIVSSAITIGSGGSGGREGPIAQIGAGFGSLLANLLRLSVADRRILMAAGMGAGIAAIFRAPLAGALFAAEVLYRSPEFEPEVIMPAAIASVVSYCTYGLYTGWQPLFETGDLTFDNPLQLGPYLLLVLFMILLASLYTRTFYGTVNLFHRMPVPRHFRPAIGAFLTGLLGLVLYYAVGRQESVLAVMAFGYGSLQAAISQGPGVSIGILLAIAIGKIFTTSLTIGSGGSGGVFGPSMVIGGCGGGALGLFLHGLWPQLVPQPASFVLVGMAGFFAAAAKTPISTLIIVSEMTGGYHLLLPALWVCVLAFLLSDEQSIYTNQVETRSRSPAHQGTFVRDVLGTVYVSEFLVREQPFPVAHPGDSLAAVLDRLDGSMYTLLPVVDDDNRLLGAIDLEEAHQASHSGALAPLLVAVDLMRVDIRPLTLDDSLDRALELFVENDVMALPIVDDLKQQHVLGMIRRQEIASAYLRRIHAAPFEQPAAS